jgi:hypothetical protein
MQRTRALTILSFVFIGIVAVVILSIGAKPVSAGKPSAPALVGCRGEVSGGGPTSVFLDCSASDGTQFVGNQRVPDGYLFLVTDVMVTRENDCHVRMKLYDSYDASSEGDWITLARNDCTTSVHFTTPYLVLVPGHRLLADYWGNPAEYHSVRVSGVLVSDISDWQ